MPISLLLKPTIDPQALRATGSRIEQTVEDSGRRAGDRFGRLFAGGVEKSSPKVEAATKRVEASFDKAANAAGRLRLEQEKHNKVVQAGERDQVKLIAAAERMAVAQRANEAAARSHAAALKALEKAQKDATSGFAGMAGAAGAAGRDAAGSFADGFSGSSTLLMIGRAGGPIGLALAGVGVLGVAAGKQLADGIAEGMATLQLRDVFQARMGLSEGQIGEFAQAAGRAYANNFGASVEANLGAAQSAMRAGLIDPSASEADIQAVVQQLQGLSQTTDATASELSRSITTLMRTGLAGSVSEASDIITAGFQKGLDVSGDWLDTINEYSTQFRKLGLTGGETMTLLKQGLEGGARDTDKVADSLKEFSIRAVDGSKLTRQGFEALGFSADDMASRFAKGGDSAKVALGAVFEALNRIKDDPAQQALVWQALFGTQWEDMGEAVKKFNLTPVKNEFVDLQGVSARSTKTASESFASEWEKATRSVSQSFADLKTEIADWVTSLPGVRAIPGVVSALFGTSSGAPGVSNPGLLPSTPATPSPGGGLVAAPGGMVAAGPGTNLLGNLLNTAPGTPAPAGTPGGQLPAAPVAGTPTPILTDAQAQAQKDVEKASKDAQKHAYVDPSLFQVSGPVGSVSAQAPVMTPAVGPGGAAGGLVVDPDRVTDAQNTVLQQRESLSEANLRLLQIQQDQNADQLTLLTAQNNVAQQKRSLDRAERELLQAQQGTWKKAEDTVKGLTSGMGQIGAALDADFGVSRGLAGIAENLTKFAANVALAPMLGRLAATSAVNPNQGSGLLGSLASQGAFGAQYTPAYANAVSAAAPSVSAMGPAALQPVSASLTAASDAALLANVPAGRYTQDQRGDLTQGLADCSSAVEDLVNIMDGRPTAGASMYTGNAAEWLTKRGFLPGTGGPGDFRVGFNSGHMQATLPGGTPFNWGSDAAAANRGIGGTGADDPAFTQHYYRPVAGPVSAPVAPASAVAPLSAAQLEAVPGLTNPALTPVSGGAGSGAGLPGMAPAPQSLTAGGLAPSAGPGGGGFGGLGGVPMAAVTSAIGMGLDAAAPGAGAAAQTVSQLTNRFIGWMGQNVGIGVGGLMETLLPHGSPLADPNRSWLGRFAAGFAGARPALPNIAGQQAQAAQPAPPAPAGAADAQGGAGQPQQGQNGQPITLHYNNYQATESSSGRDMVRILANTGPGR